MVLIDDLATPNMDYTFNSDDHDAILRLHDG